MSLRVSRDVDDLICIILVDIIKISFVTTLVFVSLRYSVFTILFLPLCLKLVNFMSKYLIDFLHFWIRSDGDNNDS